MTQLETLHFLIDRGGYFWVDEHRNFYLGLDASKQILYKTELYNLVGLELTQFDINNIREKIRFNHAQEVEIKRREEHNKIEKAHKAHKKVVRRIRRIRRRAEVEAVDTKQQFLAILDSVLE